jgi:hypothetical protein
VPKVVFEGELPKAEVRSEDGGCALIWETGPDQVSPTDEDPDSGMFVRLQSWDERKSHKVFNRFVGRRVRITVEPLLSPIEALAELG